MILLLLGLLVAYSIGFCIVCALCPHLVPFPYGRVFAAAISTGFGLGVTSCLYFILHLGLGLSLVAYLAVEFLLVGALALVAWRAVDHAKADFASSASPQNQDVTGLDRGVAIAYWLAMGTYLVSFVTITTHNTNGEWDAWAVWNLRASFLFQGGANWADGFSDTLAWSHPDYPLFLGASIARLWSFMEGSSYLAPASLGFVLGLSVIGTLTVGVSIVRDRLHGMVAGLVLLGSPRFLKNSAAQQADIPLSFFIAATLTLYALWDSGKVKSVRMVTLAGITAGFAAWTKNEGLALVFVLVIARVATGLCQRTYIELRKELKALFAGIAPVMAVFVFFKLRFAPSNDLLSQIDVATILSRVLDFGHLLSVGEMCLDNLAKNQSGWLYLLPAVLIIKGLTARESFMRSAVPGLLTCLGMACVYYFAFVFSPHEVRWHIATALNRLVLQVWPGLVLCYFLSVGDLREPGWVSRAIHVRRK
ncbi:MAG: hypothetical protein GY906_25470 [bacterium]|nr:hypothetical protein [bacterium]